MEIVFEKIITKYVDGEEAGSVSESESETGFIGSSLREEYEEILGKVITSWEAVTGEVVKVE